MYLFLFLERWRVGATIVPKTNSLLEIFIYNNYKLIIESRCIEALYKSFCFGAVHCLFGVNSSPQNCNVSVTFGDVSVLNFHTPNCCMTSENVSNQRQRCWNFASRNSRPPSQLAYPCFEVRDVHVAAFATDIE